MRLKRPKHVLGALGVIDTLNLDEAGGRGLNVARTLVAQVTTPRSVFVSRCSKLGVVVILEFGVRALGRRCSVRVTRCRV
jgi:hypothetical protein